MYKAYKYRIYPTDEQKVSLAKAFGCCRWFGNFALSLCQQTYIEEDFLHKLSRQIVNENQVIAVENLNVKGIIPNHKIAQAISDVRWGIFTKMLKYKAEWEGKTYIKVDRFFASSKTCNVCLHQVDSLPLDIRSWTCQHCGTHHDRDVNAAINIKHEALRILRLCSVQVLSLVTSDTAWIGNVRQPGQTAVLLDAVPVESGSPML
ncbi:MAG: hypothetical protein EA414_07285 [Arthrospira sp. PLM2.Bin9]|nr:RNA-guided endonuclease TnpB family protein [Arthrospira sp. PLM2.Bin9]TVU54360.1 MAG: hypothetical protein EA414_07285 [Arthrospira sp. PLM2.Bin9]